MAKKIVYRTREEVLGLWIKTLKSGKYKQGRGQLRQTRVVDGKCEISYCCLGVLCDLAAKDGGRQWGGGTQEYYGEGVNYFYPPGVILRFIFLTEKEKSTLNEAECNHLAKLRSRELAEMNDGRLASFEEIADHIKKKIAPGGEWA